MRTYWPVRITILATPATEPAGTSIRIPGQVVVFPRGLRIKAMPYEGDEARIILSFNVSVHATSGHDEVHSYANA
jgi:hypothetical protein